MTQRLESRADTVPALRRAVQILDLVAASSQNLTPAQITRAISLPKSTAHGLLSVMSELGLLAKSQDGTLRIGPHPMRWAGSFLSQLDIVSAFQTCLAERPELDPYTVTLTMREGGEVVYIGCRHSPQPLGLTFRIGMRLPAPFTATGKILLSTLSDDELKAVLDPFPKPLTNRSVSNLLKLREELEMARQRGYSIDDGQVRDGMICIGTAIRDHARNAFSGIAISLIRSEASDDTIRRLGNTLREASEAISRKVGGH